MTPHTLNAVQPGSRSLAEPPTDTLVVIEASRIVYTEHWLRRDGFAARQFWNRPAPGGPHRGEID